MAQGIQLAGGYGAGGVRDALVDLIAQKMAERDFYEGQRRAQASEQLARDTLAQRKSEATAEDTRAKAGLRENQRQFGERLGLDVKRDAEKTRVDDRAFNRGVVEFDTA